MGNSTDGVALNYLEPSKEQTGIISSRWGATTKKTQISLFATALIEDNLILGWLQPLRWEDITY